MRHIIHVNRNVIASNVKNGTDDSAIICKNYKENKYSKKVDILDKDGSVVASIIQSNKDMSGCKARVWIETYSNVKIHEGQDAKDICTKRSACKRKVHKV